MKYAVEMASGAMIYIPSFIKTGSGIHNLIEGDSQTHRQHGGLISLLLFFQNKESRLKKRTAQYSYITVYVSTSSDRSVLKNALSQEKLMGA
jgi:hypothetical protein